MAAERNAKDPVGRSRGERSARYNVVSSHVEISDEFWPLGINIHGRGTEFLLGPFPAEMLVLSTEGNGNILSIFSFLRR